MSNYKLTNRGRFVLSLFILILVVLIVYSGSYIIKYITSNLNEISETIDPMTNEETRTTESTTEAEIVINESSEATEVSGTIDTTDSTEETDFNETTEITEPVSKTDDTIYSVSELEDLKQFKITFYFPADSSEFKLNKADLDSIQTMIKEYPNEKIAIEGHVNGYPNYISSNKDKELGMARALTIVESLQEIGVDKSLLNVYNLGSESPLFTDFGNQYKNDRVEVYFIDHYIKASQGK